MSEPSTENARLAHRLAFERAKTTALMASITQYLIDSEFWNCPILKQHLQESYDAASNLCLHHTRELKKLVSDANGQAHETK